LLPRALRTGDDVRLLPRALRTGGDVRLLPRAHDDATDANEPECVDKLKNGNDTKHRVRRGTDWVKAGSEIRKTAVGMEHIGTVYVTEKWHKLVKGIAFEKVIRQTVGLREQLSRINPAEKGEFTKIKGKKDYYLMSNNRHSYAEGDILCTEQGGAMLDLMQFQMEELSGGLKKKVVLEDRLVVQNGEIFCTSRGAKSRDMACVNRLLKYGSWNGMQFRNVTAVELFGELVAKSRRFHLVVEKGKLELEERPIGYVLCYRTDEGEGKQEFRSILQEKYYNHLEAICGRLIDVWEQRNSKVVEIANVLIERKFLEAGRKMSDNKLCEDVREVKVTGCPGSSVGDKDNWDAVFDTYKEDFLAIDGAVETVLSVLYGNCRGKEKKMDRQSVRAFNMLVSLNIEAREILQRYMSEDRGIEELKVLISGNITSSDYRVCINQLVGQALTDKELVFVVLQLYNAKVRAFRQIMGTEIVKHFNVFEGLKSLNRKKRHFFTEGLAAATGLVPYRVIEDINSNTRELQKGEIINSEHIVEIEKETNEIVMALRNQSESVVRLYEDEKVLQDRLSNIVKDETNLLSTIGHIAETLEIATDIAIEFKSFMLGLSQLPLLVQDNVRMVESVLTGEPSVEVLFRADKLAELKIDNGIALASSTSELRSSTKGYVVETLTPELSDPFQLVQLRTIPFAVGTGSTLKFNIESELVGANSDGECFLYPTGACATDKAVHICESRELEIHRAPVTCAEGLVVEKDTIPDVCKDTVLAVAPKHQQYIYHELSSTVSVYTPMKDNVTVMCDGSSNTSEIQRGASRIQVRKGCVALTKELRISAAEVTWDENMETSDAGLDIEGELLELSRDLEALHGINVSGLGQELDVYMEALGIEKVELKNAQEALSGFGKMKELTEYSVLNVNIKDAGELSTTVTVVAWVLVILVTALVVTAFCVCCKPCRECGKGLIMLVKGVFKTLRCFWRCIVWCRKRSVSQSRNGESGMRGDDRDPENSRTDSSFNTAERSLSSIDRSMVSVATESLNLDDIRRPCLWAVALQNDRVQILTESEGVNVYYNPILKACKDESGRRIELEPPPGEILAAAENLRKTIRAPKMVTENGLLIVQKSPNVYYDQTDGSYRTRSGEPVYGYAGRQRLA